MSGLDLRLPQRLQSELDSRRGRQLAQARARCLAAMLDRPVRYSERAETIVWISGVELTEPYALLLSDNLFEQAEAEARALKAGTPT
jgi:hypothetical protein